MAGVSYFYVYKDQRAEWRWRFVAKNSETIAVSSEGYNNLASCEHAVRLVKDEGPGAVVIGDDSYNKLRK